MSEFDELMDSELHLAIRVSDYEGTKLSLEQGHDPNKIGLFEWSALHEAAHNGDYKILKILLKFGGDCNQRDLHNGSTSLHYAASEGHPKCLDLLMSNGGNVSITNDKGQTPPDITRHKGCKQVFAKYGIDVKTTVHFEDVTQGISIDRNVANETNKIYQNRWKSKSIHPPSSSLSKHFCKSTLSDESGIGSKTSLTDSASISSGTSRTPSYNIRGDLLYNPSSPSKSYSSFGSLTSIGSSITSGNDESAGYVMMAFHYNSKTSNLKIRIVEIVLTCLLPMQKSRKDAALSLYVSATIENRNEIEVDGQSSLLKSKSATFKLCPTEDQDNRSDESDGTVETHWNHRAAHMKFKSLTIEFVDVPKTLVRENIVKVSICSRLRKNLLKNSGQSIVIATTELPLKQAVRRLMKETYELQLCHAQGITRPPDRIDQILSEIVIDGSKRRCPSVYSDSIIQGNMNESYEMDEVERCASDGDLKYISAHNSQMTSASCSSYDIGEITEDETEFILEEVKSHSVPTSPQVKIKLRSDSKPNVLCKETKMNMPEFTSSTDHDSVTTYHRKNFLNEASGKLYHLAGEKTKSLHRLVISKSRSENAIETDEEMGSLENIPMSILSDVNSVSKNHNQEPCSSFTFEKGDKNVYPRSPKRVDGRLQRHHRTESGDSVGHINENTSPRFNRKNFLHVKS